MTVPSMSVTVKVTGEQEQPPQVEMQRPLTSSSETQVTITDRARHVSLKEPLPLLRTIGSYGILRESQSCQKRPRYPIQRCRDGRLAHVG